MTEKWEKAERVLSAALANCQKIQPRFREGTSQATLLKHRIKALQIAKALPHQDEIERYPTAELEKARPPLASVLSKTKKAQSKYEAEDKRFLRFSPLMEAMELSLKALEEELLRRQQQLVLPEKDKEEK